MTHTKKSHRGYTGFDLQVFLDFEAKNGRKSLAPQGFDGSTAAHNPEVAGSSPVSATRKEQSPLGGCSFFASRAEPVRSFRVMRPTSGRGGRITGGDIYERCLRRMKRAKRSGSGRNSASGQRAGNFGHRNRAHGSSPVSATIRTLGEIRGFFFSGCWPGE